MKLKLLTISIFCSFLFVVLAHPVSAQVCAPQRVIDQFACVSISGACNAGHFTCAGSSANDCVSLYGNWAGPNGGFFAPGNPCTNSLGQKGTCQSVCDGFSTSTSNCDSTGKLTVDCDQSTCQAKAAPTTCSSGGGGPGGSCVQNAQVTLTYSCYVVGNTPPPSGGGGGGWGSCGCFGSGECVDKCTLPPSDPQYNPTCGNATHPASECQSNGSICVWNPAGCGGGGGGGCAGVGQGCIDYNDSNACCNHPPAGTNTCNWLPGDPGYTCGDCNSPAVKRRYCGATPDLWCGQTYTCDNKNGYRCPNAQVFDIPNAPLGMTPADGAVLTGAQNTCNAACTDDIDCGAHTVDVRLSRNGGAPATYRDLYIDSFTNGGIKYDDKNALVDYNYPFAQTPGAAPATPNPSFFSGYAHYTQSEGYGYTLGTIFPSLSIDTYKESRGAYMDVYVDGGNYTSGPPASSAPQISTNLNSVDVPPVTLPYTVDVPTGTQKSFACTSGVCRLYSQPTDATCTYTANTHHVTLVAVRAPGPDQDFDAINEDGVITEETSPRFTYTTPAQWINEAIYPQNSGGTEKLTTTKGAKVDFDTTANNLSFITVTASNRGAFDVYVDGAYQKRVNLNTAVAAFMVQVPIALPAKTLVDGTQQSVSLSWTPGIYNQWFLEAYPKGTSCADPGAFCGQVTRPSHRFVLQPGVTDYVWRVQAINTLCARYNAAAVNGLWSNFNNFTVDNSSPITSTVVSDPGNTAVPVGGVCQSPGGTSVYTLGGTVTASKGATNRSGAVSTTDGSYTVNAVPAGTGYTLTFTPTDPTYSCTCPANCTYTAIPGVTVPTASNYQFFTTQIQDPWFQTSGGDVGALTPGLGYSVKSLIPQTTCVAPNCTPYFSLPGVAGNNATIGSLIVGSGSIVDLKDTVSGPQNDNVGAISRLIRLSPLFAPKENYDYFYRLYSLGLPPIQDDFPAPLNLNAVLPATDTPSGGKTAFYTANSLTITAPWVVQQSGGIGRNLVIFVNGDLTIKANVTVDTKSFLGFIVKGKITIDPSVGVASGLGLNSFNPTSGGQVQGFYLANNTIDIPSIGAGGTEKKLLCEGTFVAGNGITIKRDFRNGGNGLMNNQYPVALFLYRPDIAAHVPTRMKVAAENWQEVTP